MGKKKSKKMHVTQIKTFGTSSTLSDLDRDVNKWLIEKNSSIRVADIKYSSILDDLTGDIDGDKDIKSVHYSCIVIYRTMVKVKK